MAERVRALRTRRGWSARQLAERIASLGDDRLDRAIISNLENHRRQSVSLDEVMLLAAALNVAPVHLMLPPDDDEAMIALSPGVAVAAYDARKWVVGQQSLDVPLPDHIPEHYYVEQDAESRALRGHPALSHLSGLIRNMLDLVLRRFATPEYRDHLIFKLENASDRITHEVAIEISELKAEITEARWRPSSGGKASSVGS